ncbi:hypothetical protein ACN47E_009798 [Coniothyrium glycines]
MIRKNSNGSLASPQLLLSIITCKIQKERSIPDSNRGCRKSFDIIKIRSDNHYLDRDYLTVDLSNLENYL